MQELIHTDKPAEKKVQDRFQRYDFSKRIASIISAPQNDKSLIIGLYGKWGEGKSTILNFIQNELPKETIVINFNPWLFSDEKHLLNSFFEAFAEALHKSDKSTTEKIGNFLSDYAGAIGTIAQFVGASTDGLEKLGNKMKNVSIEKIKDRIDKYIIDSNKNIVVLVDDIDRLDINEVQYIFKVVKLVGDFPRTSYVLAFDDEMVSKALSPKYSGTTSNTGYQFLEKIVQIPLKIPKASTKALRQYTLELLDRVVNSNNIELNKSDLGDFVRNFDTAFLPYIDNPRIGVRYANTLAFSIPLLKNEANMSDLMVIEGLKIFYPELYDKIRVSPELFTYHSSNDRDNKKEKIKKEIDNAISIYDEKKQKILIELLSNLFPQLEAVYRNSYYSDDSYKKWLRDKKISSGKYFGRYFSYSVQDNDIPDAFLDQFINDLNTNEFDKTLKKLNNAFDSFSDADFIFRLRIWEEELNEEQSKHLSIVLAQLGHTFQKEDDFRFATTFSQSANLITRLIRNLPLNSQLGLALDVLKKTKTIEYAMEINYWLMYREQKNPEKTIFNKKQEGQIQAELISKFKELLNNKNLFLLLPDGELQRLITWWKNSKKHQKEFDLYIKQNVINNKVEVLNLVKVFVPTIISRGIGASHSITYKTGFYKTNYDLMKNSIDVKLIYKALIKYYGKLKLIKDPSTISDRDPIDDNMIISLFQFFFEQDKANVSAKV